MIPITALDCFAGPGGFSLGLAMAGCVPVVAIESDATTACTYAANHPGVAVFHRDIRQVPVCEVQGVVWRQTGRHDVDVVIGGPPCQVHSVGGSGRQDYTPGRLYVYREMIRLAVGLRAKVLLLENVEGILSKRVRATSGRLVLDRLRADLDQAGYTNRKEYVLDAWHFGVPQHRRRYFCLASRLPGVRLRPPRPSPVRPTIADAFADLPHEAGGKKYGEGHSGYSHLMRSASSWPLLSPLTDELAWHIGPVPDEPMQERFCLVLPGKKLRVVWDKMTESRRAELRERGVLPPGRPHGQSGARLSWDRPSWTVTSHAELHLVHPRENRIITVREAARLQSFPDHFQWSGKMRTAFSAPEKSVYEQIGSAVPPLLGRAWGIAIKQMLADSSSLAV